MSRTYHRGLSLIIGPLVTLSTLAVISLWPGLGVTVALAFVPLVWAAYTGGLMPALASAFIITAYAAYVYQPDYSRIVQVSLSAFIIAWMVGYLKHHAELSQSLNGNMKRLKETVDLVRRLKNEWVDLSDSGRYKMVDSLEDRLGNLAALVFGWHSIRMEIDHTQQELGIKDDED